MNVKTVTARIQTMNKKTVYGLSLVAAITLFGSGYLFFGKENSYAEAPKADLPVTATAVAVQPRTIESVVAASGSLSSRNTSVLSSKVMGRVVYLDAQEGDTVSEGKPLMKIDSGEIAAQVAQAEAVYHNARLHYDRIKGLYDAKASTQIEMEQATLGLESARSGLTAAKAMESYTIITAPIAGQIVEKRINRGEMALPGQPLIRIEDNRNLRLEVTVREQEVLHIRHGAPVRVRIDALPGTDINGRVSQVVPASDARTHSFIVKIDVPTRRGLITGMFGKAYFSTGSHEAILVPRSSIVDLAGITGVYIVSSEGSAAFQMVQTGPEHGDLIEVITGLRTGDRVITDRHAGRIEGRKVLLAEKIN